MAMKGTSDMGELANRIAAAEHWPTLTLANLDAAIAASPVPLAVFFRDPKGNRRETDDVAVVLRELDRGGEVRAVLAGLEDAALKRRFVVVAAPSLTIVGRKGFRTVQLIGDWSDYRAAIAAVGEGVPA
jgi:Hydrogenase-1 expression protein HyaE